MNEANAHRQSRAPWLIEAMDRCDAAEDSSVVDSLTAAELVLFGYGLDCHQSVLGPHSFPSSTRVSQLRDRIYDGELRIHKRCALELQSLSQKLDEALSAEGVRPEFDAKASHLEVCRGLRSPLPLHALPLCSDLVQLLQCKLPMPAAVSTSVNPVPPIEPIVYVSESNSVL